jgi:hypothetical protein
MSAIAIKNMGSLSTVFGGNYMEEADELGAGIVTGFGVIGIKGKVFRIKSGGAESIIENPETGDPASSIEMVVVKASSTLSKTFYANGYQDGSGLAPDCWSSNAQTPDANVPEPQCNSCVACPHNAFGSRITENGKKGKACSDAKRLAVVPLNDLENEALGGPMLIRVPAASLKELTAYQNALKQNKYPYFGVGTRISFDFKEAYPKLTFRPIRLLNDDEGAQVLSLREDPRIARILAEGSEHLDSAAPPALEFEETVQVEAKAPPAAPKPAVKAPPKVAPKPTPAAPKASGIAAAVANPVQAKPKASVGRPAPKPVAPVEEDEAQEEAHGMPASFEAELDAELDGLLN